MRVARILMVAMTALAGLQALPGCVATERREEPEALVPARKTAAPGTIPGGMLTTAPAPGGTRHAVRHCHPGAPNEATGKTNAPEVEVGMGKSVGAGRDPAIETDDPPYVYSEYGCTDTSN